MTDKELKNWIFSWVKDVNSTPLDSEINDLIYMVDAHLAPKMKRVDLDDMKEPVTAVRIAEYTQGYGDGYNRAIDDIKSKYGDIYVEVK